MQNLSVTTSSSGSFFCAEGRTSPSRFAITVCFSSGFVNISTSKRATRQIGIAIIKNITDLTLLSSTFSPKIIVISVLLTAITISRTASDTITIRTIHFFSIFFFSLFIVISHGLFFAILLSLQVFKAENILTYSLLSLRPSLVIEASERLIFLLELIEVCLIGKVTAHCTLFSAHSLN